MRHITALIDLAAVLSALLCGCGSTDYMAGKAIAAHAVAYAVMQPDGETPQPAPADACANCNGTGKLGDGTVGVTCPVCDGTGKASTAQPCNCTTCDPCLCDHEGACKEPEPPEIESALDVYTAAYEAAKTRTVKVGKGCEFELNPSELPDDIRGAFKGSRIVLEPGKDTPVRIVRPQASAVRFRVVC